MISGDIIVECVDKAFKGGIKFVRHGGKMSAFFVFNLLFKQIIWMSGINE